jgi:hypothetical protein
LTTSLILLLIKYTYFFYLIKAFLGFVKDLFLIGKAFNIIIFIVFFFFYTYFLAFSFAFTLLIFSSLTIAYNAFATFLASFLALFLACIAFLVLIYIFSDFLNISFLAVRSYIRRTLGVEKSISYIYSLLKILSFFLRALLFFSSLSDLIRPSFVYRSSTAYIDIFIFALKSFLSFNLIGFLQ